MANKKLVTVVKEQRYTYSVEGECSVAEALKIVKLRLEMQSPQGLEKETEAIVHFNVIEDVSITPPVITQYTADGELIKATTVTEPKKPKKGKNVLPKGRVEETPEPK